MLARSMLLLVVAVAMPAWCQVEPSATGSTTISLDDDRMMIPPPVSGLPYPNKAASDSGASYASAGLAFHTAYIDNVLPGVTSKPVNDMTYAVLPTLSLEEDTSRQETSLSYSPSIVFYQQTSALDTVDHSAAATFLYRASPYVTISAQNYFVRTSNVYDQSFAFNQAGVSGGTQISSSVLILPFTTQLQDNASGTVGYQYGRNGMVGAGGMFGVFNLPNNTASTGLYNSHSVGGMAYFVRRFTRASYAGFTYQYGRIVASPTSGQLVTQMHSFTPFITYYFNRAFSASVTAGVQRVDVTLSSSQITSSWEPTALASIGWQGEKGYFSTNYSRTTTSGEGLLGAYTANSANASGGWKISPTWIGKIGGAYSIIKNLSPLMYSSFGSGHQILGQVSTSHSFGEHFNAEIGYERLHQNYNSITVIAVNPDSNQEFVTLTYQFRRNLGR